MVGRMVHAMEFATLADIAAALQDDATADDAPRVSATAYARDLAARFYGPTDSERDDARGW